MTAARLGWVLIAFLLFASVQYHKIRFLGLLSTGRSEYPPTANSECFAPIYLDHCMGKAKQHLIITHSDIPKLLVLTWQQRRTKETKVLAIKQAHHTQPTPLCLHKLTTFSQIGNSRSDNSTATKMGFNPALWWALILDDEELQT